MSFDAWEASIRPSSDSLMHWGIPGMKHGRRRYQNEDGTWTRAGLEARRKREGFGERHKAKKEARKAARAERIENRRANNVKYMSDADLQKKIERLKLEKEYKDLKRNPTIEKGVQLISKYLDYKAKKDEREERRYNMQTNRLNAQANLKRAKSEKARAKADKARAKADRKRAKSDIIDNLTLGKGRKDAKARLIDSKEKAKENTLRGILLKNIKKDKEAATNQRLYKNNEYFKTETDERRAADRQKIANETLKTLAQIELGKGQQEIGRGQQEKAKTDRHKKSDDDKKKKK